MRSLREDAELLRLELLMELIKVEDVIAWADGVIAASARPPIEMIELAMAFRQPPDEVARQLQQVPGEADFTAAAHRTLSLLRERFLAGDLPLEIVADKLWVYSEQADIPETERQVAANFIDEFQCLAHWGTPEDLRAEVEHYLGERASEF